MAAKNDNRRRTQFFRSETKNVYRGLNRGLNRRQAAVSKGMPRDFMQSRGGGGWKVSRVHAVRR